jgi:hypothetical protein
MKSSWRGFPIGSSKRTILLFGWIHMREKLVSSPVDGRGFELPFCECQCKKELSRALPPEINDEKN